MSDPPVASQKGAIAQASPSLQGLTNWWVTPSGGGASLITHSCIQGSGQLPKGSSTPGLQALLFLGVLTGEQWEKLNCAVSYTASHNKNTKSKGQDDHNNYKRFLLAAMAQWRTRQSFRTSNGVAPELCPAWTAHHSGSRGQVPVRCSLAWRTNHKPQEKAKPQQAVCAALFHYYLVGRKHFFP